VKVFSSLYVFSYEDFICHCSLQPWLQAASVHAIAADTGAKVEIPKVELAGKFNSANDVAFEIMETVMSFFKQRGFSRS
jgi:hypothetical protein